jgi:hypothetical protein
LTGYGFYDFSWKTVDSLHSPELFRLAITATQRTLFDLGALLVAGNVQACEAARECGTSVFRLPFDVLANAWFMAAFDCRRR